MPVAGLATDADAMWEWSETLFEQGRLKIACCLDAVVDSAKRVNRGDLGGAEALLMAQAISLNALFGQRFMLAIGQVMQAACVRAGATR